MALSPILEHGDDVYAVGRAGPLLVVIWRGTPTMDRVVRVGSMMGANVFGFLAIVEEHSRIPDTATRKRASEQLRDATGLRVRATVIEGEGLLASLSRTTIRGVFALARSHAFLGDTVEALASDIAIPLGATPDEVSRAVRQLRLMYADTLAQPKRGAVAGLPSSSSFSSYPLPARRSCAAFANADLAVDRWRSCAGRANRKGAKGAKACAGIR